MPVFSFGKKKKDDQASASDAAAAASKASGQTEGQQEAAAKEAAKTAKKAKAFEPDPKKARKFFDYAKTVADTGNYDYAIECYVNGLRHDPESLSRHEELREVALKRKVKGGKAPGIAEKMKHSGGKTVIDKMLNNEFLWSKDPDNGSYALGVMEQAAKAGLEEVAYWIGSFVMDANRKAKRPNKSMYLKIRDFFAEIGAFDRAVEACQLAYQMDPGNMALQNELKNLQAELTMMRGRYDEGGDFRKGIANADKQKALEQEDSIAKTQSALEATIARAKADHEDHPEDLEKLLKLVRVLQQSEDTALENEAIELLRDAFERTGQYRLKVTMGDIRMKQYRRNIQHLNKQLAEDPANEETKEKLQKIRTQQVQFELKEYEERVKNYPTDMGLKYQLGLRQFLTHDFDNAIASFQEAQADPKTRTRALLYLGASFVQKEWYDEAIDTFRRGIDSYELSDDRLALDLRYELMNALDRKARSIEDMKVAEEAAKIGSAIAQIDINYKDIRVRIDSMKKFMEQLRKGGKGDAA